MKTFRDALDQVKGLRFILDEMYFPSSIGKQALLSLAWLTKDYDILNELSRVEKYINYLKMCPNFSLVEELLSEVVNIKGSIELLSVHGAICSDVDLYELKKLAIIEEKISNLSKTNSLELTPHPSLEMVLEIIDPNRERVPTFYLSEIFEPQLKDLRNAIDKAIEDRERSALYQKLSIVEDQVRRKLTMSLSEHQDDFYEVLNAFATDSMLIAKALWAKNNNACKPFPKNGGDTILEGLFNPEVSSQLLPNGGKYQPVSIRFKDEPTLILGANMGGKSVLLNTVALCQSLMQFGMYVPALSAQIALVDEVLYSAGDGENTSLGLSSFGAEMLRLNNIIARVKEGRNILAVIDEPARTTNPEEGYALVSGLVKLLKKYSVRSLITTHYSGIHSEGSRWRVKGFVGREGSHQIRVKDLAGLMDYNLIPYDESEAPREAFRIAKLLGVDNELLDLSNQSFIS